MNHTNRLSVTVVAVWLFAAGHAPAQEAGRVFTLAECVKLAMANNPAVKAAGAGVDMAEEAAGEASASYYPHLSANAGYSRWEQLAFLPSGLHLPPGTSDLIGPTDDRVAGLTAEWTLFDSGERGGRRKSARAGRMAADQIERQVRQDVTLAVHQAYYECVADIESREVAEKTWVRSNDHLKLAQDRIKAGAAARADESRAQVEVANAKLGVLRAESRLRIARGSLNTAIGLAAETPIEVATPNEPVTEPGDVNIAAAMDQAVTSRPDVEAAAQRVEAAQGDLSSLKGARGPKVVAQGSYDRRQGDLAGPDNEWLAGVAVELPLFTGFESAHRIGKAEAALSRAEAEFRQQSLAARQEVWVAHSIRLESYQAVQATLTQVADARESLRLATERYKAGAGTMNELLDAETALARSEATRIEAQKDYHVAIAAFKRATGTLESL